MTTPEITFKVTPPDHEQVGGDHYEVMEIQPVEFIAVNDIGFMEGCAIKYLSRHLNKGGAEDIRKAIHYCKLILKFKYNTEE